PDTTPTWHELLNTDAAQYGGSNVHNPDPLKPERHQGHNTIRLTLPPLATVWLRPA
ncbi:alpha amylase C-terminal domain-containing protein, partial [Streptomyces sp. NPDC001020]